MMQDIIFGLVMAFYGALVFFATRVVCAEIFIAGPARKKVARLRNDLEQIDKLALDDIRKDMLKYRESGRRTYAAYLLEKKA